MPRIVRILFALLLVAPLPGCAGADEVVDEAQQWDEGRLRNHLQQLTEPIALADSARVARRVSYAVQRMEAAGLMPARDPSFLLRMRGTDPTAAPQRRIDPTRAHVLGYIAGRHPSHYSELVVVAADLDSPGAAALLAVVRELAAEARFTQIPERSVLFALWSPPRTGVLGLADFLANPTWAIPNVQRVLLVASDGSAAESQRALETRGIPFDVVDVTDQSIAVEGTGPDVTEARTLARVVRLADKLYAQTLDAAMAHDSTVVSP